MSTDGLAESLTQQQYRSRNVVATANLGKGTQQLNKTENGGAAGI